jgi:phospholipid/cholesterol/gamma-HCH transport system substrate-binding protein
MVGRINSAFGDIEAGKGTLGKLAKDPALYEEAKSTFANLNSVTRKLDKGGGSLERFIDDPKLYENANGLAEDLRSFIADFRANPKKYMRFKFGVIVF